jgi:peptidase M1-like protein/ERAP1-like protein
MRICLVALLVACSSPAAPVKPSSPVTAAPRPAAVDRGLEPPQPALRLPRNFAPSEYAARLVVDPAQNGFTGAIAITGEVSKRSSVIWLHGRKLEVKHAVAKRSGTEIALTATPRGEDLLELRAASPLDTGTWTLAIDYAGGYELTDTAGAFKQVARDAPYVYTQFEALYARRVFPCLDEPDSKVPWQLTLDVPADQIAVSNTPIEREQPLDGGRRRVVFGRTKPLPSYLIAFGVGPFDVVDAGKTQRGTPVRIIAMKGRAPDAAYAARTSARLIDLLEEFFGSPYPYEKMDMLAIPLTVGFGAMENVGLITYAETIMLQDPKLQSRRGEQGWIVVAAHELAHQWFGDLVTTAWWDDIWLNEGFASWVEHKISGKFDPGWHEELTELDERNGALSADSLVSARQIRQPIATSDDILNAFDGITYNKGAAVLNMFESYVGHDVFIRGVRDYIADHRFRNATSAEFAAAISKAAGKDVGPAFATFLEQPGLPEITATLVCERDRAPHLALSQQRYLPPGSPTPPATKPWILPVCVAYDRGGKRGEACAMLDAPTGSIDLDAPSCPHWVMPNLEGRGYYRASYTPAEATALRDTGWQQLKPTERKTAFADIADLASLGKLPLPLVLSFGPRQLADGDRFSVGAAVDLPLGFNTVIPDELRPAYEAWLRRTFGAAAHRTGLSPRNGESLDVEAVRSKLSYAVGSVGRDPALIAEAARLAAHWRDLPQSIRSLVLELAVESGKPMFDKLFQDLFTETDRSRLGDLLRALATARDLKQQTAVLGLVLDTRLDVRDTAFVFFGAEQPANWRNSQRFIREHKDEILKRIPTEGTTSGQAFLAYVFANSCSAESRDEIVDYVNKNFAGMPGGARTVKQAIEGMDQCIARRKLMEPEIRGWLVKGGKPTSTGHAQR